MKKPDAASPFCRCMAMVDTRPPTAGGDELIPCRLEQGHDGPHEPMDYSAWKQMLIVQVGGATVATGRTEP